MTSGAQPAILVLEDGTTLRGEGFGASGETFGEMVFNTGMTGYQETLTDPSYAGQIVAMTAPHIGNTGVNDEDPESHRIWVSGYVVREPSRLASSWRARRSLDDELKAQGKTYDFHSYEGAGHAFFSVNRPAYRPEAAMDGWQHIWTWFGRYLSA